MILGKQSIAGLALALFVASTLPSQAGAGILKKKKPDAGGMDATGTTDVGGVIDRIAEAPAGDVAAETAPDDGGVTSDAPPDGGPQVGDASPETTGDAADVASGDAADGGDAGDAASDASAASDAGDASDAGETAPPRLVGFSFTGSVVTVARAGGTGLPLGFDGTVRTEAITGSLSYDPKLIDTWVPADRGVYQAVVPQSTFTLTVKGKTVTGRIWTYVRDDRPFGGHAPPAALYYASRDRRQEHPERHLRGFTGILQADAYSGYNGLYDPSRAPGMITPALCWSHARRQFFELADIAANARRGKKAPAISPVALEAVKRIDALFDIERAINGLSAEERLRVRQEQSRPLVDALETWLREERSRLSRAASVAKPIDYLLRRWNRFTPFLADGRVCLTNNAAERALRGFALGRKSWLFAGSERGAARAAAMTTLVTTAKLNDVDPLAWLADVLARIAGMSQSRLPELLPWQWKKLDPRAAAA